MLGKLDYFFRNEGMQVLDKQYEEQVIYTFLCQTIPDDAINELSSGTLQTELIEEIIVDVPISEKSSE